VIDHFDDDNELLEALKGRNVDRWRRAYLWLLQKEGGMAKARFIRNGATASESEDILQEAFIKLARSVEQFRRESSFRTWLWAIIRTVELDAIKRRRPEETHKASLDADNDPEATRLRSKLESATDGPAEALQLTQFVDCLSKAFERFKLKYPIHAAAIEAACDGEAPQPDGKSPGAARQFLMESRRMFARFSAHCRGT
jgi:RNA polymerase sigma factor (sigma-70 family)